MASWETSVAEDRSIHAKPQSFLREQRAMLSDRLKTRLERREAVLRLIDRRRAETGNSNLGWSVEKLILDLEMVDLEMAIATQERSEHTLTQSTRPARTDT
ncbi:MAG TPA: hypothetical protein VEW69_11950 [Alphaproteobacteria bacterium]|nr:hypothetical protein [Alphaproteobacteria bacterium]